MSRRKDSPLDRKLLRQERLSLPRIGRSEDWYRSSHWKRRKLEHRAVVVINSATRCSSVEISGGVEREAGGWPDAIGMKSAEALEHGKTPAAFRRGKLVDISVTVGATIDRRSIEIARGVTNQARLRVPAVGTGK
jgi:hypothetical protein